MYLCIWIYIFCCWYFWCLWILSKTQLKKNSPFGYYWTLKKVQKRPFPFLLERAKKALAEGPQSRPYLLIFIEEKKKYKFMTQKFHGLNHASCSFNRVITLIVKQTTNFQTSSCQVSKLAIFQSILGLKWSFKDRWKLNTTDYIFTRPSEPGAVL